MIFTKDKSFYRSLILLAIPIALQNFVTFSVGLADNIMVGRLGDAAISGVYIGGQIQNMLQIFSAGIEGAMLILAAQYWGKKDTESIKKIIAVGLRFSFVFAAAVNALCLIFPIQIVSLFTDDPQIIAYGVEYLRILSFSFVFFCLTQALIASMRSVESARIGMTVSLVSLALNIILNYVLIFGKLGFSPLGVAGAAIATLISRICEFGVITFYVLKTDKKLRFGIRDVFKSDKKILRDFIKYGWPLIVGQLVWAINTLSLSAIMGRNNVDGVIAALSLVGMLNNLSYIVVNGMAGAVGIIIGKTIGSGSTEKIREYSYTVQIIFLILGVLTGGFLRLIKIPFISLYNLSPAAVAQSNALINVLSCTIIGTSYQAACLFGLVKSGGDVYFVMKNDAFFVFLVVLPAGIIASVLGAPPWVIFLCLKSDQILKCFVAVVKINRFKWMKNLTENN